MNHQYNDSKIISGLEVLLGKSLILDFDGDVLYFKHNGIDIRITSSNREICLSTQSLTLILETNVFSKCMAQGKSNLLYYFVDNWSQWVNAIKYTGFHNYWYTSGKSTKCDGYATIAIFNDTSIVFKVDRLFKIDLTDDDQILITYNNFNNRNCHYKLSKSDAPCQARECLKDMAIGKLNKELGVECIEMPNTSEHFLNVSLKIGEKNYINTKIKFDMVLDNPKSLKIADEYSFCNFENCIATFHKLVLLSNKVVTYDTITLADCSELMQELYNKIKIDTKFIKEMKHNEEVKQSE